MKTATAKMTTTAVMVTPGHRMAMMPMATASRPRQSSDADRERSMEGPLLSCGRCVALATQARGVFAALEKLALAVDAEPTLAVGGAPGHRVLTTKFPVPFVSSAQRLGATRFHIQAHRPRYSCR